MNKRESKKFEKQLIAERDRLTQGIRQLEKDTLTESAGGRVGDFASFAEAGTDNFERETALGIASEESEWLNDINDALARIEDGSYGVCEGCSKPIPKRRLEVFPAAGYCVECQSKIERDGEL